ncbi:hypothetical protein LTR15_008123 [Elasticomyces elasticus]|nr:hypothetical protein LTR15_008123 [Elasticomyces elasticus]
MYHFGSSALIATAYLAIQARALPRPIPTYSVVDVDGGASSAAASTIYATITTSLSPHSATPTTVSVTVIKSPSSSAASSSPSSVVSSATIPASTITIVSDTTSVLTSLTTSVSTTTTTLPGSTQGYTVTILPSPYSNASSSSAIASTSSAASSSSASISSGTASTTSSSASYVDNFCSFIVDIGPINYVDISLLGQLDNHPNTCGLNSHYCIRFNGNTGSNDNHVLLRRWNVPHQIPHEAALHATVCLEHYEQGNTHSELCCADSDRSTSKANDIQCGKLGGDRAMMIVRKYESRFEPRFG